jgi:IMP dehydrogenase/GMP reductase
VEKCQSIIDSHQHLQEVHDYCLDWTQGGKGRSVSLEMGFYRETWAKMEEFNSKIDKVPSGNSKVGSILIETNTLKKQLIEMPRQVIESIRHNVTQTMEQETKTLREELGKTSEILDQLPTSLNTYVEQVNTLKYIDHKQAEFDAKYQTINKLNE